MEVLNEWLILSGLVLVLVYVEHTDLNKKTECVATSTGCVPPYNKAMFVRMLRAADEGLVPSS